MRRSLSSRWRRATYSRRGAGAGIVAALTFGEEHVEARSELWRCDFRYSSFRRFALCRGRYLLFYTNGQALAFAAESVEGGDARAFEGFIKEKTGLSLEQPR